MPSLIWGFSSGAIDFEISGNVKDTGDSNLEFQESCWLLAALSYQIQHTTQYNSSYLKKIQNTKENLIEYPLKNFKTFYCLRYACVLKIIITMD